MTLPSYTLASARSAIRAALRANASAQVDRVGRIALDAADRTLKGWLAIAENPQTPEWRFGKNWGGPGLQSVLASCGFHRDIAGRKDAA